MIFLEKRFLRLGKQEIKRHTETNITEQIKRKRTFDQRKVASIRCVETLSRTNLNDSKPPLTILYWALFK
jgi:hypothetical protein